MNLKFLIVLTMVFTTICVLPVNAVTLDFQAGATYVGTVDNIEIIYTINSSVDCIIQELYINDVNQGSLTAYEYQRFNYYKFKWNLPIDSSAGEHVVTTRATVLQGSNVVYTGTMNIHYSYGSGGGGDNGGESAFDIDIDLQENPTFELGVITNLEQTFNIGSSSNRVVKLYNSYAIQNSDIIDLQRNYVKIKLNPDFNYGEIFLSGKALLDSTESDFTTKASFNYTYFPVSDLQAFIQTFDYQSGNMVSGVNLSVYEVIDNGDSMTLGNMVYSSISAESQTILMLKNNTDYFVKNELGGYLSVKNEEYPLLNNEVGYLWSPSVDNPLILYYSRLDPTAQYNVGFIVQDTSNNGLSGVSVTMDNSVTKITNSIGGVTFNNVSSGQHSFTFVKNGYQSAQITKNIQMQYATFYQTLFADNQIVQPTTQPTVYPTVKPTIQPTISPVEQPKNIADSVKYGLAKVFGVNSVDTINLIFALLIILFPAVIGGVITNQAMGFVAGGMIGFTFSLAIGLIPIWVFFSMVMLAVIYLILSTGNNF